MKKKILEGYIYNFIYQLLIIVTPLIVTPYVTKILGISNIGIYSFVSSIFIYINMIQTFGINIYGQREIAYYKDDDENRNKTFIQLMILKLFLFIILNVIYYTIFKIFNIKYTIYFNLFIIESISSFFDITWFFQGLSNFKKISIRNTIIKIIYIILIFILIKSKTDLKLYFLIVAFSNLLSSLSLWPSIVKKIKLKKEFITNINYLKILKNLFIIFLTQIIIYIYTVLNKTMLGILNTNISEVGYYELAIRIIQSINTLIISLSAVIAPIIANNFYKKNNELIKKYLKLSFEIVLLLGIPITLGICLISKDFISLFLGNEFTKVTNLIYLLSLTIIPIGITNIIGSQYLISIKKEKHMIFSILIGAVTNRLINFILVPKFGAYGIAISSIITEILILIIDIIITAKDFDYKTLIIPALKYLVFSFFIIIPFIILYNLQNNWILLFIKIFISIILYLLCLICSKNKIFNLIKERCDI